MTCHGNPRMPRPAALPTADLDRAMLERWRAHRTGLAPYYPLLYALVIGMGAQRVFEFGTGESSQVLLAALEQTDGTLISVSPDLPGESGIPRWRTLAGLSSVALAYLHSVDSLRGGTQAFDLVLHDGSHSAEVVAADLGGILPRVKSGGLVLIHDTLHSYVGAQVREGVFLGRDGRHGDQPPTRSLILPFAFGLTILQVDGNEHLGPVSIGPDKPSSPHHTVRWGEHA